MITTVSPILADHAVPGPPQGQWTVSDWEQLPADELRYEIIDGVLYMTTAPSFFHQWIINNWIRYVGIPAQERGLGVWATAPAGVLLSDHDAVQPGFVLILATNVGMIRDRRIRGAPDLVVEVLSPGNSTEEMAKKRAMYARAGVPLYIEVDPATRTLATYQSSSAGQYCEVQLYYEHDTLAFGALPDIALPIDRLFADAPDTTL